jgi:hypothetical protein
LTALSWDVLARPYPDAQGRIRSKGERQPRLARKPPKVISPGDPSWAWTAKANKRVQFGYGLNYLIDVEDAVSR